MRARLADLALAAVTAKARRARPVFERRGLVAAFPAVAAICVVTDAIHMVRS
jgi:hypothetical protein